MSVSALEPTRPRRSWLAWGLWLVLTAALLVAIRNIAWTETIERLSAVRVGWVAGAIVANFAILPLWAAEWRLITPTAFYVAYARMFEIVTITASVLNSVPFFAGEASAVGMLIARARLSRSAAASVLALDQLLVAFAKLLVLALAAYLVPLPPWLRAGVSSLAIGFVALLLSLLVLAHSWERVHARMRGRAGRVGALATRVITWGRHLDALREKRRAAAAMTLALLKKAAEIAAIVAIQLAFGLEPSVPAAVLVVACLAAPPAATLSDLLVDEGILDTHTATIDWGDGSPLDVAEMNNGLYLNGQPDGYADGLVNDAFAIDGVPDRAHRMAPLCRTPRRSRGPPRTS